MHNRRMTALLAAGTAVLGAAVAATGTADAAATTHVLPAATPLWTAHANRLGAADPAATVRARVYFQPRGGTAKLKQFVAAVSDPTSASYRHFLSAKQYQARFGVRDATVSAMSNYLRGQGLTVTGVARNNHYVSISGTVAATENAFHTQLSKYRHNGDVVRAPSTAVSLPSSLSSSVLTVTGLDTTTYMFKPASTPPPQPAGFRNATPCSRYFGQIKAKLGSDGTTKLPTFRGKRLSYAPCGYTGPQFRSAYEGDSTYDGSGITVAITDAYASPSIASDANTYAKLHGDGAYGAGQLTQHNTSTFNFKKACGSTGWYGEETLDVEAVHAMAPGANIEYYGAKNCGKGLLDALQQVADDDTAQLVTNSWGALGEGVSKAGVKAYENAFMEGSAEGMSYMFSSGDDGDDTIAGIKKQADYPATDPYVTAVGGTSTGINAKAQISFQTGWGTDKYTLAKGHKKWVSAGFIYGAGGGTSKIFTRPSYQDGYVANKMRQIPDVAMDADPSTGMLVGETQAFPDGTYYDEYRIGGTSLASPLFTGMTALTLQASGFTGGIGAANDTIYSHAASGVFSDVHGKSPQAGVVRPDFANGVNAADGYVYSVRTFNDDSSLQIGDGYDTVTGLGVPNAGWITALGAVG